MSAQSSDQIGVFDLLIQISDECPAGQMRRGDLVKHPLFFFAGGGVYDRNQPLQSGGFENPFDRQIVFLLGDERQQFVAVQTFVTGCDLFGCLIQRNPHGQRSPFLGLARYVFDGSVDQIRFRHFQQITHPAADQTLKNEDVALNGQLRMPHQIRAVNLVQLLDRDIIRRSVCAFLQREIIERSVPGLFVAVAPVEESSDARETIQ